MEGLRAVTGRVGFYLKSPDPRHGNHPSCEYEKMRKKGWTKLDQPFNQIKHTTKARGNIRKQTCPCYGPSNPTLCSDYISERL
jgi:hypothetical protein